MFEKIYYAKRTQLKVEPDVDLSDLLAARTELAIIEKTSSSSVRKNTKSKINKVIIGMVCTRILHSKDRYVVFIEPVKNT